MKFIDEATIVVQSGDGGRGCVSLKREKFIPRGGPDGGDGGKGGNVIFKITKGKRTLYHFRFKNHPRAKNGKNGQSKNKTGKNGDDLIIEIPSGTVITDADSNKIIMDFINPDEIFTIAEGGRGGQGNARFKSSTNRTPRFAQPGEPGKILNLKLELKLLADVGIIGLPNAGKSTLITAISSAHPKVGNYPFTTLSPVIGVVQTGWREPFFVADMPGLIEDAHKGAGLGIRFLKHIERTRILIHLIDATSIDSTNPLCGYNTIINELAQYNIELIQKPQIVVLNKLDIPGAEESANIFQSALKDRKVLFISAIEKTGLNKLKSKLVQILDKSDE